MLKELQDQEAFRHICDNRSPDSQELGIYLHDIQPYAISRKNGAWLGSIKFCPYCGVEIEKEERP